MGIREINSDIIIYLLIGLIIVGMAYTIFQVINKENEYSKEKEEPKSAMFTCKCGSKHFSSGPSGGSFGNFSCTKCGARYNNLGPFGIEEIKKNGK